MPTYNTDAAFEDFIDYINDYVKTNGNQEITGAIENYVENTGALFTLNAILNNAKSSIYSTAGQVVVVNKAFNVFTQVPTSIAWSNTLWFYEYYLINMTASPLPLASGFTYYDQYQTQQTAIPSRTSLHIAMSTNGLWFQVNNAQPINPSTLPTQFGHSGETLFTDGSAPFWKSSPVAISSTDFEPDGKTYINTSIPETIFKYEVFYNDINRFIYQGTEWDYVAGGGIEIAIPGFDSNTFDYHFYIFLKGLNG